MGEKGDDICCRERERERGSVAIIKEERASAAIVKGERQYRRIKGGEIWEFSVEEGELGYLGFDLSNKSMGHKSEKNPSLTIRNVSTSCWAYQVVSGPFWLLTLDRPRKILVRLKSFMYQPQIRVQHMLATSSGIAFMRPGFKGG